MSAMSPERRAREGVGVDRMGTVGSSKAARSGGACAFRHGSLPRITRVMPPPPRAPPSGRASTTVDRESSLGGRLQLGQSSSKSQPVVRPQVARG